MKLVKGIYENLINKETSNQIEELSSQNLVAQKQVIDDAESPKLLSEYLANVIRKKLEDEDTEIKEKVEFVNHILEDAGVGDDDIIIDANNLLSEVMTKQEQACNTITKNNTIRPLCGFRVSNLFTGGQSQLSLNSEIVKDIATADEICLIVSFLKLSGIRIFIDALRKFTESGHHLKIITTTYCGVTEEKAILQLSELPNTEIRISYETKRERLHAKSYIFMRNSGLSTAYIGSSNLSKSALTDGLEWNIRTTAVENPHIINAAKATFEQYWNSKDFEDFKEGGIERFREKLKNEKEYQRTGSVSLIQNYQLLPHQKKILEDLRYEREQNNNYRNLVVAATGTGKTVMSAFDYNYFRQKNKRARLLFVAHRKEILEQSRRTYCNMLHDANFGELWVGNYTPQNNLDYLFVSIQTLNSNFDKFKKLGKDFYDYIVLDESHHGTADSYRDLFSFFNPKILIGLTATPERMDGQSLLPDFGGKISAEIRLPQALEAGLLSPFQYFCITDFSEIDLSSDSLWSNGGYDTKRLSELLSKSGRVDCIINAMRKYLADENNCKALCFCVDMTHAKYMANEFLKQGFKADYLISSEITPERRKTLADELRNGKLNYLFVVDIFNEGIDIPEVDTVLFLRPTESLTIFLQQLGRGLRLSPGKEELTVLDFVAQANKQYNFAERFRSLCVRQDVDIKGQVSNGFSMLPHGCSITMEQKAQTYILENIKNTIYNINRLRKELSQYPGIPSLKEFTKYIGQDIRLIYRNGCCWTSLKREAGKCNYTQTSFTKLIEKNMSNLIHINSVNYLQFINNFANGSKDYKSKSGENHTYALMLYYAIFQTTVSKSGYKSIYSALADLQNHSLFMQEIKEICDYHHEYVKINTQPVSEGQPATLELYGCYTREEIFTIYGIQNEEKKMQGNVSGVYNVKNLNTELFFVTLNKSDKDFSPSTQYKDYLINEMRFHWQSQNTDSHQNNGQRFVLQSKNKKKFVLFVRNNKNDGYGNTCPFYCFGLVDYISSSGDKPMNVIWELHKPAMPQFLKAL